MKDYMVTLPKSRGGCEHLQEKIKDDWYDHWVWWEFSRLPKYLAEGSKLYIVCEGALRGYFTVHDIGPHDGTITQAFLHNWHPLDPPIPMESFRGYREYKEDPA